jgi:predicted secreted protein
MNPSTRRRLAFVLLGALSLGASVACAESDAEGAACRHHAGGGGPRDRATFQVEAVREVANDWATARMTVQAEGKQAAAVAAEVNTAMKSALDRARRADGIEVRSGGYSTQPVYDDGRVVRWRASQTLLLESGDTDALSSLIGTLQSESVMLSGIEFGVRRETRREVEDALISEALTRFRARAALVAEGLGAKDWSVAEVNVGAQNVAPPPVYRHERALSMASAPAPSFAAGTSEIRVTASGTVRLE